MRALRLAAYLGDNMVPIAAQLAGRVSEQTGIEVLFDPTGTWQQCLAAITAQDADVYWMCGLLTVGLIDSGALDADIVAAPVFPGQGGPHYHSVIVASAPADGLADLRGRSLVINEPGSWSGNHGLRAHLVESGLSGHFFSGVVASGGHERSIDMLIEGSGEVAAVDHTIWERRLERDSRTRNLFVIARTRDWPAPPFSLHRRLDPDVRARIATSLVGCRPVGLDGVVAARDVDYDPIRTGMTTSLQAGW